MKDCRVRIVTGVAISSKADADTTISICHNVLIPAEWRLDQRKRIIGNITLHPDSQQLSSHMFTLLFGVQGVRSARKVPCHFRGCPSDEMYHCDSKLHWKNMPYSQTGSSHVPSTPLALSVPAELRNAPTRNQTISGVRTVSGNDHSKNASMLVRKPVMKIGELLHGPAPEQRARKPTPGTMTQFMIENDLLPDVHGQLRPVAHDQCIVVDLPATFPFGYRPRRDRSGRRRSLENEDQFSSHSSELSRMFPFWWQHSETRKSKPAVSRIKSHCLHRSTEPEIDLCHSSRMLRYRSLDGTCNNLLYTKWGAAGNRYSRLTTPTYDDGTGRPRLKTTANSFEDQPVALPNARKISKTMSQSLPIPHSVANLFLPYFGQLVAHDLAFTPTYRLHGQDVDCCVHNAFCNQPECFQFSISTDDSLYSQYNLTCHQFARSEYLMHKSCTSDQVTREQFSRVTHWLDASFLYGNDEVQNREVRNLFNGQMAFRNIDTGIHNLQHKPVFKQVLPNFLNGASCPFGRERDRSCFLAGDERVNQQPAMAAVHMIFSRFHNLVAGQLSAGNPHMSDEMVFQEARKVVIAVYQIIVYQEFLPGLLGPSVLNSELYGDAGLQLNDFGHFDHYEPETDPHVLNEFATAGFRLHTLISDIIPRLKLVTGLAEATSLSSQYNNHSSLYEDGSADVIINGLLEEPALAFDSQITVELQGRLFRGQELPVGLDLLAISIQRGRDHGLGTYNDVREACGYGRAGTFEGLGDFIPEKHIFLLRSLYRSVEDIDLIVGGLLEDTVREDASVGSTFACLIATEFQTKRFSDRFWHERSQQFSLSQLDHLRKITMSQIICLTTGIRHVAAQSFLVVSDNNPLVPCSSTKEFDIKEYFTIPGL